MATATARRQQAMRLGPVAYGGFPVRSLTRQKNVTGGGEWITAYQADQKRRLKAVLSASVARETGSAAATLRPPTNTREVSGIARKSLNKFFLLQHCYVEEPTDLCVCSISGAELQDYKPDDLTLFTNVVLIDASDNHLPLEAFRDLPELKGLELSLNHVVDVGIHHGDFSSLETLDLSYNSLSGCSLLSLGTLPSLKELHLTGNSLVALPVEMSRPFTLEGTERTSFGIRFASLERLWLDDNKLTDQATFATLAGLRMLKYLNLDNNEIYTIPQLRLLGTSPLRATSKHRRLSSANRRGATPTIMEEDEPNESDTGENQQDQSVPARRAEGRAAETTGNASPFDSQRYQPRSLGSETSFQTHGVATPTLLVDPPPYSTELGDRLADSMAPFPQLETLSLINNLILTAEGLLACESWPILKQLIVYGNPLTRITRGMPPLLQSHLVEQRGVRVVRHRPSSRRQHTVGKATKDFKKVSTAPPPTIPRHPLPLLPSLEAPPRPPMLEYPSPPPSSSESCTSARELSESSEERGGETDEDGSQQGVFLTQPAGDEAPDSSSLPADHTLTPASATHPSPPQLSTEPGRDSAKEKPWSLRESFQVKRQALREKYRDIPERFRGYELLLDTYDDPSMPLPSDVHSCTRALQYALRHPVVLGHPKSSSHPAKASESFLKRKPSTGSMEPQLQLTSSVRNLQHVLDDIRKRCLALETNLSEALHPKTLPTRSVQLLQRDSRQLLSEMQARYDKVRESSLHALRELSEEGSRPSSLTTPTRGRRLTPYRHRSPVSREGAKTNTTTES